MAALQGQVRDIARSILEEYDEKEKISSDLERLKREREVLERVTSDAFWRAFDQDPQASLLLLDTKLAPLASEWKTMRFGHRRNRRRKACTHSRNHTN